MLKRLLIVLAILLGLAALADRFLASAAGDAAGGQVRRAVHTQGNATVNFRGFPFVTQALGGRFRQVDVVARDVPAGGLTLARVDARFTGVRLEVGKALVGELAAVTTNKAAATARLTYADLNDYLRRRGSLSVSASGGQLWVTGQVRVNGALIAGKGTAAVTVRPGSIVLAVSSAAANGIAIPTAATRLLTITVPTAGLPFGMALQRVDVHDDALLLRGTASGIVIPTKKLTG